MNRTSLQMKVLYNEMGKSEKKIAEWILENPDEILPLSIVELAEKCKSSEATIVRFAKRLGFGGYQELKISLAKESGKKRISENITEADSCFEILEKVSNEIYSSLELTKKVIDKDLIEQAAQKIFLAEKVVIFGLGNSSSLAMDAGHKFLRAGRNAVAYSDNHMQAIAASHLTEKDVAIGISHSGSSKDIVDALKIAKSKNATTICITNKGKSPILKQSDIALFTQSPETQYTILGLYSRISALAIINAIYLYMVSRNNETLIKAIDDTEQALHSKKY